MRRANAAGGGETHLEPVGQRAQQLDFDGQADERGHAAVGDGGRELDAHRALAVVHLSSQVEREPSINALTPIP